MNQNIIYIIIKKLFYIYFRRQKYLIIFDNSKDYLIGMDLREF